MEVELTRDAVLRFASRAWRALCIVVAARQQFVVEHRSCLCFQKGWAYLCIRYTGIKSLERRTDTSYKPLQSVKARSYRQSCKRAAMSIMPSWQKTSSSGSCIRKYKRKQDQRYRLQRHTLEQLHTSTTGEQFSEHWPPALLRHSKRTGK